MRPPGIRSGGKRQEQKTSKYGAAGGNLRLLFFFLPRRDIFLQTQSEVEDVKKMVLEPFMGLLLIAMVFLAVQYGGVEVLSGEAAGMTERPTVVIDAGHGGSDPGKVGVDGSLEKDINLEIALRLKKYLEQSDVRVIMTREEDAALSDAGAQKKKMSDMQNRCAIANESSADLAVSIHQNSYHEEEVCGGQVFYYQDSPKGKELAEILQGRFDYVLGEANRRLAKPNGNYYLLLHVRCPIVIVECGFLSNWKEASLLNQAEYQDRLAWTIHMGIMEYLNRS
jgi:N-acetylmuramoyl-L-alanine amidase